MKWIISLLILFLLESVVYGELLLARTNSSNLCSRIPSQSCLHQLKPSTQEDDHNSRICTVEAANNTHPLLCDSHRWNREEICQHDGCGVHLEIYRHMPYPSLPLFRTALNLTLSNISSSQVKIRFQETSINNLTFCINFTTSSTAAQPFDSLWYDCVFHSRQLEGHPFQLEFLNSHKYGMYLFQLPAGNDHLHSVQNYVYYSESFCLFLCRERCQKWAWLFVCSSASQSKHCHHFPGNIWSSIEQHLFNSSVQMAPE